MENDCVTPRATAGPRSQAFMNYIGAVSGWRGRAHTTDTRTRAILVWAAAALALLCMPGYAAESAAFLAREFSPRLDTELQIVIAVASGLSASILHFGLYLVGLAAALSAERALFGAVFRLPGGRRIGAFMTALTLASLIGFLAVIPLRHVTPVYGVLIAVVVAVVVICLFAPAIAVLQSRRRLPVMLVILGISGLGILAAMPLCEVFDGSMYV